MGVSSVAALRRHGSTPAADGTLVQVLGYRVPGDGGGGVFRWSADSTAADDGGLAVGPAGRNSPGRWIRQLDATSVLRAEYFGARCNGSSDDADAYQAAADAAAATKRTLHVGGAGPCVLSRTVAVSGAPSLLGDGPAQSVLVGTFDGPLVTWTASGADHIRFHLAGFTLRSQAPGPYGSTRGILIQGDADHWLQHGSISDVTVEGAYAAFEVNKGSYATAFGLESRMAYTSWTDITVIGGAQPAVYGWLFRQGSGTGTTYGNVKTNLRGRGGAVFRYEGNGAVVGDIVIHGGHFGGVPGSKLVSVGPGTAYRANIAVVGSQLDAGMDVPFDLDANGVAYTRLLFGGNNVGGTVNLGGGLPAAISNSILDDQLVSGWRAGVRKGTDATGAQGLGLFAVTLGAANTGTKCEVTVSGQVGGVGGGIALGSYLLGRNGGATTVATLNRAATTDARGYYAISTAVEGATTTFSAKFAPRAAGSSLDAQVQCSGGAFAIRRL